MTRCSYFSSTHWRERVAEATERWSLTDLVATTDLITDEWGFAKDVAEVVERERVPTNRHGLTIGRLLETPDGEACLETYLDRDALVDAWVERWDLPDQCHRRSDNHDHCLYHRDPTSSDADELKQQFLTDVENDESQFVGARFGALDLEGHRLTPNTATTIDCRYASFDELRLTDAVVGARLDLSFSRITSRTDVREARFEGRLLLRGAVLCGRMQADHCRFEAGVVADRARFGGPASLRFISLERGFEARGTTFEGPTDFHDGTFGNGATFEAARFLDTARFQYARFEAGGRFNDVLFEHGADFHHLRCVRGALFRGSVFNKHANFRYGSFGSGTNYRRATFRDSADFSETVFQQAARFGSTTFGGETTFDRATFQGSAGFDGTVFDSEVTFQRATMSGEARFEATVFSDTVSFERATLSETWFESVRSARPVGLHRSVFEEGAIRHREAVTATYDLTEATVGPVRLQFGGSNPFDAIRFVRTEFDGFEFSDHPHREHLSDDWRLHDPTEDISNQTLETTYLKAKNGANDVGDNRAASAFFLKEMAYRRKGYLGDSGSLPSLRGGLRWAASWLLNVTSGYGEKPLYTTASAGVTVLGFATLFYCSGVRFSEPREYIVVSLQSFVALILGDLPTSDIGPLRILTSIEAFVGAFFIGLFVFSLTRSVHR